VNRNYAVNACPERRRRRRRRGLNQYSTAGSASFTYDANGNLTSDASNSYIYDPENRLVSVTGGHTANLVYDPLGRLQQIDNGAGTTTKFVYDGDALVDEYDGSGNRPGGTRRGLENFLWGRRRGPRRGRYRGHGYWPVRSRG
jgi:uncharacterized protein RhaS with RHS repeats